MIDAATTRHGRFDLVLAPLSAVAGAALVIIDTRPGWDDTAVTAGGLFLCGLVVAALSGRRPWIWALLIGIWLPLVEVLQGANPAIFLALLFALAGAIAGYAIRRGVSEAGRQGRAGR